MKKGKVGDMIGRRKETKKNGRVEKEKRKTTGNLIERRGDGRSRCLLLLNFTPYNYAFLYLLFLFHLVIENSSQTYGRSHTDENKLPSSL